MSTHTATHTSVHDTEPTAVLVGVQVPGVASADLDASLDELERLVNTLGMRVVARLTQALKGTGTSAVLGAGKLRELAALTGGSGVVVAGAARRRKGAMPKEQDAEASPHGPAVMESPLADDETTPTFVVFDQELTPTQLRNVSSATDAEVLDRSAVILGIFQRHARTREAKLQVEIARLVYLAPRMRATGGGGGGDRQRGGIGGKGAGESTLELDRRRARDRIAELRIELVGVQKSSDTRRARRDQRATVALIGYTNAGKSSLMRGLTGSQVLVRDQLFATLDTTVRLLEPPSVPLIFVSDTVGFIKKLPHDLVASFRSTLQEAREANVLLFVVDASDPAWPSQLATTREALGDVGAGDLPGVLVLNKSDRLDVETRATLTADYPDAILLSAHDPADIARLRGRLITFFERDMIEQEVFVSYADARWVNVVHKSHRVLSERHDDKGTHLLVRADRAALTALRGQLSGAEH